MSTELKKLKGKVEISRLDGSMTSDYKRVDVSLNMFWGGSKRGKSLQITFLNENNEHSHVQLNNRNVKKLIKELTNNFSEE